MIEKLKQLYSNAASKTENKKTRKPFLAAGLTDFGESLFKQCGAEGRSRTGTGLPTRPSSVRVYQFHHFGTH